MKINLIGDCMLGGLFSAQYLSQGNEDLPSSLKENLLSGLTITNLEAAASSVGGRQDNNKISVYTKLQPLDFLKEIGVNFVSLANNHMMDFGYESVIQTKNKLDELGIFYSGCGKNLEEARTPAIITHEGRRVAILSYSWTNEFLEPTVEATVSSPGVAPINERYIKEDIEKLKSGNLADYIIISLHWGEGMIQYPRPEQIEFARRISLLELDVIFGHHAHCIQGAEIFNGKAIFYGVGNFLSSPYIISESRQMLYDTEGKVRDRYKRERRVGVFELNGDNNISISPFIQNTKLPKIENCSFVEACIIKYQFFLSSYLIKYKYFGLFAFFRRVNEVTRLYDEISTRGPILKKLNRIGAIPKILKRIYKGEEYH